MNTLLKQLHETDWADVTHIDEAELLMGLVNIEIQKVRDGKVKDALKGVYNAISNLRDALNCGMVFGEIAEIKDAITVLERISWDYV